MDSALFIQVQAVEDLKADALQMASIEAERQAFPMLTILNLYARRIVALVMAGWL